MMQEVKPNVGLRLRTFRERHGWSLRALSERCGLSINAISRIERGENSPTVSSLFRLSTALSVPITDFFIEKTRTSAVLVKNSAGQRMISNGFEAEHLGMGLPSQQLDPYIMRIEGNCESTAKAVRHPGEEFVYCLAGQIEYCVNDQLFEMQAGDSLLFEAMQPHHWRNTMPEPAIILVLFQAALDNSLARHSHLLSDR